MAWNYHLPVATEIEIAEGVISKQAQATSATHDATEIAPSLVMRTMAEFLVFFLVYLVRRLELPSPRSEKRLNAGSQSRIVRASQPHPVRDADGANPGQLRRRRTRELATSYLLQDD